MTKSFFSRSYSAGALVCKVLTVQINYHHGGGRTRHSRAGKGVAVAIGFNDPGSQDWKGFRTIHYQGGDFSIADYLWPRIPDI